MMQFGKNVELTDRSHRRAPPPTALRRGVTLFELLIVLAILSTTTLVAAGALGRNAAGRKLDGAGKQLLVDLKSARLRADALNADIIVAGRADGYRIDATGVDRVLPAGIEARWNGAPRGTVVVAPSPSRGGALVALSARDATIRIEIAPLTGRIAYAP